MSTQFKNRRELILHLNETKAELAVEVGVRDGYFSKFILDNTSVKKLYAIDPWERNAELGGTIDEILQKNLNNDVFFIRFLNILSDSDIEYVLSIQDNPLLITSFVYNYINKNINNTKVDIFLKKYDWIAKEIYETCKSILEPFGERCEMIKGYSPSASEMFEDASLDFVYIDGAHDYNSVKSDLDAWYKKLKIGGILSGHDYHLGDWPGVYHSVNEFIVTNKLELNLTGLDEFDINLNCKDGGKPSFYFTKK
jgi:hypothetical protein